ncbi:MAG: recombination mediator RecR [Flammeovirgaceae bacterium]|nr:recombination mediator RecR [Flammeovirgaceae bacterium]
MSLPSKLLEEAVKELSKLPGIGKKTALRLALFLLKEEENTTKSLCEALVKLKTQIKYCKRCYNISDEDICQICANNAREQRIICVVEGLTDVLAIENTGQYRGLYHVLGGVISPIEGVSPQDIRVAELLQRVSQEQTQEVILALSATMEGDTTAFYLSRKLKEYSVKITTIARGVPIGSELEYADEITLGRSIVQRIEYK